MSEFDWKKFLSLEFLTCLALLIVASVALFVQPVQVSFVEWGSVCGSLLTVWTATRTVQKGQKLKALRLPDGGTSPGEAQG